MDSAVSGAMGSAAAVSAAVDSTAVAADLAVTAAGACGRAAILAAQPLPAAP